MAGFNNHEAGVKLDESVEDGHLVARAFDYTEEVGIPCTESQFVNLDVETEELDLPHFVGDLKALMVDDSEDDIVLDSDDEVISEQKEGKTRGHLWRRASAVGAHSFEVRSSVGSNLTDKATPNDPNSVHADTRYQKVFTRKPRGNLILNDENVAKVDLNQDSKQCREDKSSEGDEFVSLKAHSNDFENAIGAFNESPEPGDLSQANALSFVDRFLSVNVVNSSPETRIPKFYGLRSPLASCARGSQNLAKKANLLTKVGSSTFDWDENQSDHVGEFVLRNKKELHIQRGTHLNERFEDKFKESVLDNSKGRYSRTDVNKSDEQIENEFVGFDTQMAAEAMESLLYAPPPENLKNLHDKSLKVVTQKKASDSEKENIRDRDYRKCESHKQMHQKVKTFSPVACRTRHGSSGKCSKRAEETCILRYTIHGKEGNILNKRKMGDLDTNFLVGKRINCPSLATTSGNLKFDTWNWPKKKRTCRNMRETANLNIEFGRDNENSVVGPGETSGNIKEAFLVSRIKRKARSASKFRATTGKKLFRGSLIQKFTQPSLADVTNIKCVSMSKSVGGEQKMKHSSSSNEKSKKQMIKRNSTSFSLRNELSRFGVAQSFPDLIPKDLRRRRSMVKIRVLFSQNLDDEVVKQQRKIMTKLGMCMAKDCSDATHFVADRFARTKKMLEAMAFGKPVVTSLWLESCEQARCVIDEKHYILRDTKKEKEIGFSMPVSLSRARANPLLKDQRVIITPNVEPNREIIRNLVKAVHGQVMEDVQQASMEYNISDNLLILSCEQDYETCVPFLDKGAAVYRSELLLNGIIIQKLEYTRHQLFTRHVKMLRYTRKRRKSGS